MNGIRKLLLGYGFLVTSTALAIIVVIRSAGGAIDWLGLAAFVAAQASGILSLMLGFKAEYQNKAQPPAQ